MDRLGLLLLANDGTRLFWCPGCRCAHFVDDRWTISGAPTAPTIRPSIAVGPPKRCHLFVTDGQIQYLADSDHRLAGQTVPMEPL